MKVLIDISEKEYNYYRDASNFWGYSKLREIILNGTPLPKGATNGDMIKALFPNYEETRMCGDVRYGSKEYYNLEFVVDEDWWDAPYKKEVE
jgi:hypothetical protein